jgi:putative Holliday junction resolvase
VTVALGLDLGSKRIGVAVSDRSGTIAAPLITIERSGSARRDRERIASLVDEECAEIVVVGLPTNMDGTHGPAALAARSEAAALASVITVPVVLSDERRSTVTAQQAMIVGGRRAADRRRRIDQVAAAVLLQHWLDGPRDQAPVGAGGDR